METYMKLFADSLGVKESEVQTLQYQAIPAWDSVGHMALMAALEEAFSIELETDDIIDFSSFEKGIEILKKYGINLK
ncbi:acyl carrier protein [Helicobacter cinaedi]|uniref:acyl carrier protein n=1 Tax=Helicobacter cinaedi TaxID=213 RepID=UPI000CF05F77|nr:acyl carrier protein [Helicobacter cinaedi]AWK60904.1 acyl carrier protein [Helicobacter cinaedi]QOQ96700.1 acyl carrier protein [Helicobacter cinaedi]